MIYPFMTLKDNTEVAHTEKLSDGTVKVFFEKADITDGFHSAVCILPECIWEDVDGFSKDEMNYFENYIKSISHLIIEFAEKGGFENATKE